MSEHDDRPFEDEELTDEELALLGDVDALLADPAMWGSPATDVEDRVVAAIADGRRTTTLEAPLEPVAAAGPAPVTAARPAPVGDLAAQRVKRRSRWSMVGAAAVGAAAAALVVGVVMRRNDDAPTTADSAPSAQVTLAGTDLAPGVTGSASLTSHPSGVELHLDVPGLPNRSGGDFYQVWVKTCDGSLLVPAGSFHDLTDAIGWVGVSMDDYPVITVTQETAVGGKDAGQGSSGLIVASGTLGSCPS